MKAIVLRRHGAPEVLKFQELPCPEPGPGEVRVKVHCIGLNYAEILSRKGWYGWAPPLPYTPGMEACGIIDATGRDVSPERRGERVIAGTKFGAYAEYLTVPARQALPAVPDFDDGENAAFAVKNTKAMMDSALQSKMACSYSLLSKKTVDVSSVVVQVPTHGRTHGKQQMAVAAAR